ncbi:hypothetical protein ACIB24_10195 [Spongisporangium articulatum]|uniref:Uncharacterized protein n=1 Tax=Spongisporangium articulatum TaxID=3362603 RepID=A0ABW8AP84_9ACTN
MSAGPELMVRPGLPGPHHARTAWSAAMASHAPGHAFAVERRDRLRVVLLEWGSTLVPVVGREGVAARQRLRERCRYGRPDEIADSLAAPATWRRGCSGVTVVDLRADGWLDLASRGGPPPVVVHPDRPAETLCDATSPGVRCRVAPDDVLLLCSAAFLEEPPDVLASLRDHPGADGLLRLREGLLTAPATGAVAMLAQT